MSGPLYPRAARLARISGLEAECADLARDLELARARAAALEGQVAALEARLAEARAGDRVTLLAAALGGVMAWLPQGEDYDPEAVAISAGVLADLTAEELPAARFDLDAYLGRLRVASLDAFGPGPADLEEVGDDVGDALAEIAAGELPAIDQWAWIAAIALDGALRSGARVEEIPAALERQVAQIRAVYPPRRGKNSPRKG